MSQAALRLASGLAGEGFEELLGASVQASVLEIDAVEFVGDAVRHGSGPGRIGVESEPPRKCHADPAARQLIGADTYV